MERARGFQSPELGLECLRPHPQCQPGPPESSQTTRFKEFSSASFFSKNNRNTNEARARISMPGISFGMLSHPSQMPVWPPVRASAMPPPAPPPFCQKGALIPTSQVNPWEGLESKEWSQLRTSNHDFGRTPTPPPDTFLRLAFHLLLPVLLQFALPIHGLILPTLLCQRVVRARGGHSAAAQLLSPAAQPFSLRQGGEVSTED